MKIWTVWKGSYSDRNMLAVFSTFEKAESFRKARAIFDSYDIDGTPIEFEVDEIPDIEEVVCIDLDEDGNHVGGSEWFWQAEDVEFDGDTYHIRVNFNADPDVMIKAARDKLTAYKAREWGI